MRLYKELDWWSMTDALEEIMEGSYHKCFAKSEYAGYYDELLTELANAAGDFWDELEKIKGDIYRHDIPYKARKYKTEDDDTENAAFWVNAVALTLTETDVDTLFYREEVYVDYEIEKQKRLNMLDKLSKKDFLWLITTVSNLIIRFIELISAWETIKGTIDELDSRQAFIKNKDGLQPPQAAYL